MNEDPIAFWVDIFSFVILMLVALPLAFDLIKQNYLYGVRVKWSMYNETTWKKSNKLAGILLFLGNLISLIVYIIFPRFEVFMALLVIFTFLPCIYSIYYSYKIYKIEIIKSNKNTTS